MDDDQPRTPDEMLALLEAERRRAAAALEPDIRLVYGVWGGAWLIGFGVLWLSAATRGTPGPLAAAVFAVLMTGAMVVTVVHSVRRTAGVRGRSARVGAMYGWTWGLAFAALSVIMGSANRLGVGAEAVGVLWTALAGLLVGILYLIGGALWQDRVQYGLGIWVLGCSAAGAVVGFPGCYLVMGLAGGGGFAVAALLLGRRRRESR
jgi:hypothetical protein